jgi:hypothetical protein
LATAALAQAPQRGLERQGAVVGQVCADLDGDGRCSADEPGLPGARVMLETGLTAIADHQGRFHLAEVNSRAADPLAGGRLLPGRHRVRVDTRYFPPGTRVSPDGVTIEVPMGGIAHVVFAVRGPERKSPLGPGGAPARAQLDGANVRYLLTGIAEGAAMVEVGSRPAELGEGGAWSAWITLQPGANAVPITVRSADGQVAFFERDVNAVHRPNGFLIIPGPAREGPRIELPAVALEGAAATVTGPPGARVQVDGREVVLGPSGRAQLVLAEPATEGYQLRAELPGFQKIKTRAEALGAFSITAVALLDLELTLDPQRLGVRLFGRGAGAVRVRAWGFDLAAELDLR